MISVKRLLQSKDSHEVCTLTPQHMVMDALALMGEKNIGSVVIMDGDQIAGIFSERDYARKGIVQGRKAKSTPVCEVMTEAVHPVTLDMDIEDCMQRFVEERVRHLPVVEDGRLIGLLSIGDIVNAIIQEQNVHIRFLEQYITGR
jgi:CBS domain-containing protein